MTLQQSAPRVHDRLTGSHIPLLGRYIWLSRFGSLEVPVDELVARWRAAGLDPDLLPDGIRARSGMLRAIDKLREKGELRDHPENGEDEEKSVYVLVIRRGDVTNGFGYDVKVTFTYWKKEKRVTASDPTLQALLDGYFAHFQTVFQTKDIRKIILDTLRHEGCISLKEDGGIYFLPVAKFDVVDKLQAFARSLGQQCRIDYSNVPDTADDADTLSARVVEEMGEDLTRMAEEIAELLAKPTTQKGTLSRRLDELDQQRAKVRMFAQFLAIQEEELLTKADAAEQRIRAALRA